MLRCRMESPMDRRNFVRGITGLFGVTAMDARVMRAELGHALNSGIKAVAFDGFVIFDPRSVEKRVEEQLPGRGAEFTNLWRMRQFEYSWLRTAGGQYSDFWRVTDDALRYAAKNLRVELSDRTARRINGRLPKPDSVAGCAGWACAASEARGEAGVSLELHCADARRESQVCRI